MRRNYPGKGRGGCFLDRGGSKVTDPDVKRAWNMPGTARMEKGRASIWKLCYRSWTLVWAMRDHERLLKRKRTFSNLCF